MNKKQQISELSKQAVEIVGEDPIIVVAWNGESISITQHGHQREVVAMLADVIKGNKHFAHTILDAVTMAITNDNN